MANGIGAQIGQKRFGRVGKDLIGGEGGAFVIGAPASLFREDSGKLNTYGLVEVEPTSQGQFAATKSAVIDVWSGTNYHRIRLPNRPGSGIIPVASGY